MQIDKDLSKTTPKRPAEAALRSRPIIALIASHMALELREAVQLSLVNKAWWSMLSEVGVGILAAHAPLCLHACTRSPSTHAAP